MARYDRNFKAVLIDVIEQIVPQRIGGMGKVQRDFFPGHIFQQSFSIFLKPCSCCIAASKTVFAMMGKAYVENSFRIRNYFFQLSEALLQRLIFFAKSGSVFYRCNDTRLYFIFSIAQLCF